MDEEVQEVISRVNGAAVGLTAIFAFAGGAAVGAAIAMKRMKAKYEALAQEEIDSVKRHYVVLRNESVDPEAMAAKRMAEDIAEKLQYSLMSPDAVTASDVQQDIQDADADDGYPDPEEYDDWDTIQENTFRKERPNDPYPITKQEFDLGEENYEQTTLTYFDGDNVLVDERDSIIPSISDTIGEHNVLRFGYGSQDENVIYIRNNRIRLDIEVVRDPGSYSEKVLGVIEHSERRGLRKFRPYDE